MYNFFTSLVLDHLASWAKHH